MKRSTNVAIGFAVALALGLGSAVVTAHPRGQGPGGGPGQGYGVGPRGGGNPAAAAEARLAYLKSELKISSGQETAWNAYAELTKQQAEAMHGWRTTVQGSAQATAPERLELRSQIMKKRQEQVEKTTGAFKDLYAALTPEQKAIADQRFAGGPGYGRGFHGGPGARLR